MSPPEIPSPSSVTGRALLASLVSILALSLASPEDARAQRYGAAADVADGTVLISEPAYERRPGTVYLYRQDAGGTWSEVGQLRASDADVGDYFGRALAVEGDLLWAGATGVDSSRGAAYVLQREAPGEWREVARLQPDDLEAGDSFGRAVAVDGDVALVSSAGQDSARGAVYAFRRDAASGQWTQEARITADDGGQGSMFGLAVALRGDVALVGAPGQGERAGAAYVFRHDPDSGEWRQTGKLEGTGVGQNAGFGAGVLIREDRALVSAPGHDRSSGAVFVFDWNEEESEWEASTRLLPFDGQYGTGFGATLALVDGELWIGAPGGDGSGTIYRYALAAGQEGGWSGATKLTPEGVERGDNFASSLTVADGVAAAGLTGDDYGAGTALIMERDEAGQWAAAGKVWSELENYAAVTGEAVTCGDDGRAAHFECDSVDLLSFLPVEEIGGTRGVRMSDIWGWTDPETGREYALAGRMDGTAFVDVTDPTNPVYLGSLPLTDGARPSSWRDIKVYRDHAFIVADNAGDHGVQVFDLTRLRDVSDAPTTFDEDAHYDRLASVHNIVVNPGSGFAYAVGSGGGGETCGGGLHMIDISEPTDPTFAGCFADERTGRQNTGYTHDAQCLIYEGPDEAFQGQEICLGLNETAVSVADVTDKEQPQAVSVSTYPNYGYVHQGWFGPEQRYFYVDDELDELQDKVDNTRTMVWDMTELSDPILVNQFFWPTRCSDHNLYVVGERIYASNYQCGFGVLDISDREAPQMVGSFDTVPYGENEPSFGGSWSNYPYFESGIVVVNSGQEGLFVLRPTGPAAASQEAFENSGPVRSAGRADTPGSGGSR